MNVITAANMISPQKQCTINTVYRIVLNSQDGNEPPVEAGEKPPKKGSRAISGISRTTPIMSVFFRPQALARRGYSNNWIATAINWS
jgi:hypothetical protein